MEEREWRGKCDFHSLIGKKMDVDEVFQPNQPFFPSKLGKKRGNKISLRNKSIKRPHIDIFLFLIINI